jgi:ribosomal protein S18 acetylase RimI-like enzyme
MLFDGIKCIAECYISSEKQSPNYDGKYVTLWGVLVKPEYRNKGIGYLFLSQVISEIDLIIDLTVDCNKLNAIKLYEKLGFTEWKTENGFKYMKKAGN